MARDRDGPRLALQVLEVPVVDIGPTANDYPSVARYADGYGLERSEMDAFIDAYLPEAEMGLDPYASPLLASSLAELAPAHILTAEYDLLRDSGEAYARRLEDAEVPTTLRRYDGFTHGTPVLWQEWAPARAWMDDVTFAVRNGLHSTVPQ
jgi:acetyl esterase